MQFEDFDKRLRDAADQHHASYHEKGWEKMEKLLDLHMPRKKEKKRRFLLFFLAFLLLGGGGWLISTRPWEGNQRAEGPVAPGADKVSTQPPQAAPGQEQGQGSSISPSHQDPGAGLGPAGREGSQGPEADQNTGPVEETDFGDNGQKLARGESRLVVSQTSPGLKKRKIIAVETASADGGNRSRQVTQPPRGKKVLPAASDEKEDKGIPVVSAEAGKGDTLTANAVKPGSGQPDSLKSPILATNQPLRNTDSSVITSKKKSRKSNSLSISVSAGPDISSVGFSRAGKWMPVAGAGISYTIRDRFTVSTGFYSARKVYSATPSQYKPDQGLTNPVYLEMIDADCRVYEIPLAFTYHFGMQKKQSWFASAGLSSYLMKKESYDYIYKYPGGGTYIHNYTMENESKHLFSVLSFSGGYTRQLGNRFSLSAEPYIKMPLGGVGFGNIRLNSGGVLFTLRAKITGNK